MCMNNYISVNLFISKGIMIENILKLLCSLLLKGMGKKMNTKDSIIAYLKFHTEIFSSRMFSAFTANKISQELHVSRSLASQYLNELFKEQKVIKVNSRPVYFFDKHMLEEKYHILLQNLEYVSIQELLQKLNQEDLRPQDFKKAIGYYGSLSHSIANIKATFRYPNEVLPIVLYGEQGSGKAFLSTLIHEYGMNYHFLKKNSGYRKITLYADQNDIELLFGTTESKGLIEELDGGILYLEHAEYLSLATQKILVEYFKSGTYEYHDIKKHVNTKLVLGVTQDISHILIPQLVAYMPMICYIPSLKERSVYEKEGLILKLLQLESLSMHKRMYISKRLLRKLIEYCDHINIDELQTCIKKLSISTFVEYQNEDSVHLCLYHLSLIIPKASFLNSNVKEEDQYLYVDGHQMHQERDIALVLMEQLIELYHHRKDIFLLQKQLFQLFDQYYHEKHISLYDNNLIYNVMENIFTVYKEEHNIYVPEEAYMFMSYVINEMVNKNKEWILWENEHHEFIHNYLKYVSRELQDIDEITQEMIRQIFILTNIKMDAAFILFMMLNIYAYNASIEHKQIKRCIISFGNQIATANAKTQNSNLQQHLLDSIDIPLHATQKEIEILINTYLQKGHTICKYIFFVEPSIPLSHIGYSIHDQQEVMIIYTIDSHMIAHILKQKDLYGYLEAKDISYQVITKIPRPKVWVLITSYQQSINEKLANILEKALTNDQSIPVLYYQNNQSLSKLLDKLTEIYDVQCYVKSADIDGIDGIALDVLQNKVSDKNRFNQYFTIEIIAKQITILNSEILLPFVKEIVTHLQKLEPLHNRSLMIYIIALLERLITNKIRLHDHHIDHFAKEQSIFIKHIYTSFKRVLEYYHICMPIDEIAYLYEYIKKIKVDPQELEVNSFPIY